MKKVCTIDDSTVMSGELLVYSHAIITPDDIYVKCFSGRPMLYKEREKDIFEFLIESVGLDHKIFACRHYTRYPSIDKMVYKYVLNNDKKISKYVKDLFIMAHHTAKASAWEELKKIKREMYLEETSSIDALVRQENQSIAYSYARQ
jgi:hypothetical protein